MPKTKKNALFFALMGCNKRIRGQNLGGMDKKTDICKKKNKEMSLTREKTYTADAVALLKQLIATPSVSRDEKAAADILENAMRGWELYPQRSGNNLWAVAGNIDAQCPTLLLNAHIDTVDPRPVLSGGGGRPPLWSGQQRLRRRTDGPAPGVQAP